MSYIGNSPPYHNINGIGIIEKVDLDTDIQGDLLSVIQSGDSEKIHKVNATETGHEYITYDRNKGFQSVTSWADNERKSFILSSDANGIGQLAVEVYEDVSGDNVRKTEEYLIDMPAVGEVRITAPAAGGPRNSIVTIIG